MQKDPLTRKVIGCAIAIHRHFGPGLFESAYEDFMAIELMEAGLRFQRQVPIPAIYKGHQTEHAFRADLVIEETLIVEIKSLDRLAPVHDAQVLTYLSVGGFPVGLLINFNVPKLVDGVKRYVSSAWRTEDESDATRTADAMSAYALSPSRCAAAHL